MDAKFWHSKWAKKDIAFHEPQVNPLLTKHFNELTLEPGKRIFVPLCGKTRDIGWLLASGYRIAGAELSELAVNELFHDLNMPANVTDLGELKHYTAQNIDIYAGDFFKLNAEQLGKVDAIYDRAALVAMPSGMRDQYAQHLMQITDCAAQLLISVDYDQQKQAGPPFSVNAEEVRRLYERTYGLAMLESAELPGGLKGICAAEEQVWLLRP